jgi:crossover junction endodeoxyribonuclease RusA
MPKQLHFVVRDTPIAQGSMKNVARLGQKARTVHSNPKLKAYREHVALMAIDALNAARCVRPFAEKHVAVSLILDFYFEKPQSVKRKHHVVPPDCDKICRAIGDALTGILWADDAQIADLSARKFYGLPERVEISATIL